MKSSKSFRLFTSLTMAALLFSCVLSACSRDAAGGNAGPTAAGMTRDEFKDAVIGKTPDQVLAAIGKPDNTSATGPYTMWMYHNVTGDEVTGKGDSISEVMFQNGVADNVTFL